jgi:hypothetical protein
MVNMEAEETIEEINCPGYEMNRRQGVRLR